MPHGHDECGQKCHVDGKGLVGKGFGLSYLGSEFFDRAESRRRNNAKAPCLCNGSDELSAGDPLHSAAHDGVLYTQLFGKRGLDHFFYVRLPPFIFSICYLRRDPPSQKSVPPNLNVILLTIFDFGNR